MKTKNHVLTAVFAAIAIALYLSFERVYLFGIIFGVLLPDIFEPPTSRFHRHFFHSKRLFRSLLFLLVLAFFISLINNTFYWAFFGIIGYLLHLLGDWIFHGLPR